MREHDFRPGSGMSFGGFKAYFAGLSAEEVSGKLQRVGYNADLQLMSERSLVVSVHTTAPTRVSAVPFDKDVYERAVTMVSVGSDVLHRVAGELDFAPWSIKHHHATMPR